MVTSRKLDALNLPPREFEGVSAYLLAIPHPPQLRQAISGEVAGATRLSKGKSAASRLRRSENVGLPKAIGHQGAAEYVGIWFDNGRVSINDGYSNFTSSNPGWETYWNHPHVANYIYALRCFGSVDVDFYGKIENHGVAEHGLLLADGKIYLAEVKDITKILQQNPDKRPDWIRNATEENLLDPQWQERYRVYSSSRLFPKHNLDCLQATRQMLTWLDGNF